MAEKEKKNEKKRPDVRQLVYTELLKAEDGGRYFNRVVDSAVERYSLSGVDRGFYTALLYGVAEKSVTLDYIISRYSKKKPEKLDAPVLAALRLGIYQILYMDRVPVSAACNESVKLVKKKAASAAPFVNAILRRTAREKPDLDFPELSENSHKRMSVRYSIPEVLADFFCEMYGEEKTDSVLSAFDCTPYTTLRVNTRKVTREKLLSMLVADGTEAYPTVMSEYGINLAEAVPLSDLKYLEDGLCYVQGEASQLATAALKVESGHTVIDMCAAPGGKSFGAAVEMDDKGKVFAFDLHESKLSLIEKGAETLSLSCIEAAQGDSSVLRDDLRVSADRVICDVPCSGFGVIMKKPDMLRSVADRIEQMRRGGEDSLPELQYRILCNAAEYLKHGGRMVYSTCTLNRAENEAVVEKFLSSHAGYRLDTENCRCLFPSPEVEPYRRTDGFFYAAIDKL